MPSRQSSRNLVSTSDGRLPQSLKTLGVSQGSRANTATATAAKTSVRVVDPQNRVQSREVQVGVESSNNVEILAGLTEGERVIVGNLGSYQPGELVRPKRGAFTDASGMSGAE